jgi:DNA-binding FadR family transcriptional regulator
MDIDFVPLKKVSLAEAVAQKILGYIRDGYLSVGDKLPPERELCQRFKVSRTSLREGIKALVHMGILESIGGSGVYVQSASVEAVLEQKLKSFRIDRETCYRLIELREALESFICESACTRATGSDLEKLGRLVRRMERLKRQGKSFSKEDVKFHRQLSLASHNEFACMIIDTIVPFIHRWIYTREELVDQERTLALHRAIVQRLKERDSDGAKAAIAEHFRHTRAIMRKIEEKR